MTDLRRSSAARAQMGDPTSRARLGDLSVQTRYVGERTRDGAAGSSVSTASDLGWGLGFGYNVTERFDVGLFFSWRSANYAATVVPGIHPEDTQTYSNWLDTSTLAVSAERRCCHGNPGSSPRMSGNGGGRENSMRKRER